MNITDDVVYPRIEAIKGSGFKVHMSKGSSLPGFYLSEKEANKGLMIAVNKANEAKMNRPKVGRPPKKG